MADHFLHERANLGEIEAATIIDDGDTGVFLLLQSTSSPGFSMSGTFSIEHAEALVTLIQKGIDAVKAGRPAEPLVAIQSAPEPPGGGGPAA